MLINFFETVRACGIPSTIREYLDLLAALQKGLVFANTDHFYHLARATLIKDEKYYDRFDCACQAFFEGLETSEHLFEHLIPDEWLKKEFINQLSEQDKALLQALGSLEKLLETFKQRLAEQQKRHAGGNRWIGTGGTSPFGAYGYNPSGIRIGQEQSYHQRAAKVWDKRQFQNLDDDEHIASRNIKMALRRLRRFAREGAEEELDLDNTIQSSANKGLLDIKMVPSRRNHARVLLFMDVGGPMDVYTQLCENLFASARSEFKHLAFFYFHNYLYESVWQDNQRRNNTSVNLWDILHRYNKEYSVIFVGDAQMSPYEIISPGGSVEHWNEESGETWMSRVINHFDRIAWLNPTPSSAWQYSQSTRLIQEQLDNHMYPLTINGLEGAMHYLSR